MGRVVISTLRTSSPPTISLKNNTGSSGKPWCHRTWMYVAIPFTTASTPAIP